MRKLSYRKTLVSRSGVKTGQELHSSDVGRGSYMSAQSREMRLRRQHSHQAVNIVSEPLEITLGRYSTLGHEEVNLAQFRRHVTNIITCIL